MTELDQKLTEVTLSRYFWLLSQLTLIYSRSTLETVMADLAAIQKHKGVLDLTFTPGNHTSILGFPLTQTLSFSFQPNAWPLLPEHQEEVWRRVGALQLTINKLRRDVRHQSRCIDALLTSYEALVCISHVRLILVWSCMRVIYTDARHLRMSHGTGLEGAASGETCCE
jgi:hypothetical protein